MQPARPNIPSRSRRRGVTLLEMLVTVALLLLMMLVIVAIFQTATGAVTVSRNFALIEQELRRLDTTFRQDLSGVTCTMTPPNNPNQNSGYFEYAENGLSDAQDEDSDDTLRFTAKAPDGRPFTGRIWVPQSVPGTDPGYAGIRSVTFAPIPVTSQYAEIIYFLRGDKLYRRVLLILPKQRALKVGNQPSDPDIAGTGTRPGPQRFGFATNLFEPFALFRPIVTNGVTVPTTTSTLLGVTPFVSWQGLNDISTHPSSFNVLLAPNLQRPIDYTPVLNQLSDLTDRHNRAFNPRFANDFQTLIASPMGASTWVNIPDGLPDDTNVDGVADYYPTQYFNSKNAGLLNDTFAVNGTSPDPQTTGGFRLQTPDVAGFPYVYPNPFTQGIQQSVGLLHSLDPTTTTYNHNPLPTGDSLPVPNVSSGGGQTWWGFPTWRETMAPTWQDPIKRINDPPGSSYFTDPVAQALGEQPYQQTVGLSLMRKAAGTPFWLPPQPGLYTDGVPNPTTQNDVFDLSIAPVFEDDLIAINVRSFNIKAFDPNPRFFNGTVVVPLLPGYYDLGYASGLNVAHSTATPAYMLDTLGHEGRMPPLSTDNRVDAQYPTYTDPSTGTTFPASLGDDTPTLQRMRRTWDSWSTTYTVAPATPLDPSLPWPFCGPLGGGRAVTPSYPAPYPVPLRGIEIQLRLTDPASRYVKTLTIHQDFSDKL